MLCVLLAAAKRPALLPRHVVSEPGRAAAYIRISDKLVTDTGGDTGAARPPATDRCWHARGPTDWQPWLLLDEWRNSDVGRLALLRAAAVAAAAAHYRRSVSYIITRVHAQTQPTKVLRQWMIIAANYTVWDIQVYVLNVQCIFKPQQIRVLQNERRQTRGHFVSHDIPTSSASSLFTMH